MLFRSTTLLTLAGILAGSSPARAQEEDEELVFDAAPSATTSTPEPVPPTPSDASEELRAVIAALEARLAAVEARAVSDAPPAEPVPEAPAPAAAELSAGVRRWRAATDVARTGWWDALDLRVSGYLQAQAEFSDLSQDEITADGAALNQDRFLIRRARLRVERTFKFAHAEIELDANTVRGPFVSLRRANASFFLPGKSADAPPYVMITAGLDEIPFGYEIRQGHRARPFMERTAASLAFFRGEPDVGLRLSGGVGPFRYDLALQNGVPLDDRPNAVTTVFFREKSFIGRLGFDVQRPSVFRVSGGVSYLAGTGFHAGTAETKADVSWRDLNQDGNVTLNELLAEPAQAATPSSTFKRWAVGADLQVEVQTPIGGTRVYGEVTLASNLDRSTFVADPVVTGYDLREFAWMVAVDQEVTKYAVVGFRADDYDPNTDLFESRRGEFLPLDVSLLTLSPVFGVQLPRRARLLAQYDHVIDNLGRNDAGEPIDLKNNRWTARLQVEF